MTERNADQIKVEDHIIRYREIETRRSHFRPRDMALPRFERQRYSLVGRKGEGSSTGKKAAENEHFTVVYIKAEPGKGFASHAHETTEVFVVLSGRWECTVADQHTAVEPFDVISVPPGVFHSLMNIGEETGLAMAINAGHSGAPIQLAPEIMTELREAGFQYESDLEFPPGSKTQQPS